MIKSKFFLIILVLYRIRKVVKVCKTFFDRNVTIQALFIHDYSTKMAFEGPEVEKKRVRLIT